MANPRIPLEPIEGNPNVVLPSPGYSKWEKFHNIGQITHRLIATHKRAQVIVTMHASKLKAKTKYMINKGTRLIQMEKGKIQELTDLCRTQL